MKFEFDPAKDEANRAKHGMSFAEAAGIHLESAMIFEDSKFESGERRFVAFGPIRGGLCAM